MVLKAPGEMKPVDDAVMLVKLEEFLAAQWYKELERPVGATAPKQVDVPHWIGQFPYPGSPMHTLFVVYWHEPALDQVWVCHHYKGSFTMWKKFNGRDK